MFIAFPMPNLLEIERYTTYTSSWETACYLFLAFKKHFVKDNLLFLSHIQGRMYFIFYSSRGCEKNFLQEGE